ncbi:hypothetical protein NKR23_g9358 [Pleurostoma richardsiae]|uniref:Uncharacterized protein n=1 Tax=Pleurostoma richardsiae TaxID=41990 RepID=A0AA38VEY1_9PEZI|nr:hypothetical protein NKR23_g9358 [Pleurostoma richardsiae]
MPITLMIFIDGHLVMTSICPTVDQQLNIRHMNLTQHRDSYETSTPMLIFCTQKMKAISYRLMGPSSRCPIVAALATPFSPRTISQQTPPDQLKQEPVTSESNGDQQKQHRPSQGKAEIKKIAATAGKSMKELDEELRLRMEGISGEGGAAGVEYEDGKAEGLRRGVKSNMFRVI